MASKPNPVASSTRVDIPGAGKMVQDWDADGNPYGQPHAPANPNLDSGFSIPANQIKSHTSGVLGGAHMGGHSDVAAKPAPVKKQATMPAAPKKKAK